MSFTNDIETKILKKLTGQEVTVNSSGQPVGSSWTRPKDVPSGNSKKNKKLQLKLFMSSPGENGETTGAVTTNLFITPYSQFEIGQYSVVFKSYGGGSVPNPLPTDKDTWQMFYFGVPGAPAETPSEVTSIALCDAADNVIWSEALIGSAVRKYRNVDSLRLVKITFGFTGNAICRDLASAIFNHIFSDSSSTGWNEISQTYLTFYQGDPGFDGTGGLEVGTRIGLGEKSATNSDGSSQGPDTANDWTISNGTASNTEQIVATFDREATVTHVALRGAPSAGQASDLIYWRGPLLSPQRLAANDNLAILPGQLALSID